MKEAVKLPIGIENFEEIRTEGFYYVDKTGLIRELLDNWGKVNLFTRPRRFGKSLNMNMLQYFFEYGCNASLFEGLQISKESQYCQKYMGKFPVVSITLKGVSAKEYGTARGMLCSIIGNEAKRFGFLQSSDRLQDIEKKQYRALVNVDANGRFLMPDKVLADSLRILCELLHKHYGQKTILLIDEYDVPLDKAQQSGYYEEMVATVKNIFAQALKSNNSLQFAVLTGCLLIAKESIFTGLNNMKVFSITDMRFASQFGFTAENVKQLLAYYHLEEKFELVRAWYDGYRFGNMDVYCPWDVINYVDLLRAEPTAAPRAFWVNTSSNDIVRNFIQMATSKTRQEIEELLMGKCIPHAIHQELTYRDLYKNIDNIWSVLFTTGYLTCREPAESEVFQLVIPNAEIRQIFVEQFSEWYQEEVYKDMSKLDAFCDAFPAADAGLVETLFNAWLSKTISIRDTNARKHKKENFYHGILLGLLSHREKWDIDSNAESGDGFSDILIEILEKGIGIVVEVKYPDNGNLERACEEALAQIEKLGYEMRLRMDGMRTVVKFGIACYKKQCRVIAVRQQDDL